MGRHFKPWRITFVDNCHPQLIRGKCKDSTDTALTKDTPLTASFRVAPIEDNKAFEACAELNPTFPQIQSCFQSLPATRPHHRQTARSHNCLWLPRARHRPRHARKNLRARRNRMDRPIGSTSCAIVGDRQLVTYHAGYKALANLFKAYESEYLSGTSHKRCTDSPSSLPPRKEPSHLSADPSHQGFVQGYKGGTVEHDTLGALGIPSLNLPWFGSPKYDEMSRLTTVKSCGYHFVQWMPKMNGLQWDTNYVNLERMQRLCRDDLFHLPFNVHKK